VHTRQCVDFEGVGRSGSSGRRRDGLEGGGHQHRRSRQLGHRGEQRGQGESEVVAGQLQSVQLPNRRPERGQRCPNLVDQPDRPRHPEVRPIVQRRLVDLVPGQPERIQHLRLGQFQAADHQGHECSH